MSESLPPLFKKTSKGQIQQWTVAVEDRAGVPHIVRRWGHVGGKTQEAADPIKKGKNIGKANATTPRQQAELEARALWTKQQERDSYTLDATGGESAAKRAVSVMLAKDYAKEKKKVTWHGVLYTQPKLDGRRAFTRITPTEITMISRRGDIYTTMDHIIEQLRPWQERLVSNLKLNDDQCVYLDGELFTDKVDFDTLGGAISRQTDNDQADIVDYHIYDLFIPHAADLPFSRRYDLINGILVASSDSLKLVETHAITDEARLLEHTERWQQAGFEGSMLRLDTPYDAGKRSSGLLKVKSMRDDEFEVIGYKTGRGVYQNIPIFICKTNEKCPVPGVEFDCVAPGTLEKKRQLLSIAESLIGRKLTVKYFDFLAEGRPRFPVAKAFRDESDLS
jgi:DNA ligase-1